MSLADRKATVRQEMRAQRAGLPGPEREAASERLAAALPAHPSVARLAPGPVLVPVGHRSEIGTDPLAERLVAAGWTLVRPRSDPAHTHIDAVAWPLDRSLVPGYAGIPEPTADAEVFDPTRLVLILVPGVGFARDGHRIGSGLGFFDRFLASVFDQGGRPVLIGIGYALQLVDTLPSEPHDVALHGLQLEGHSLVCHRQDG